MAEDEMQNPPNETATTVAEEASTKRRIRTSGRKSGRIRPDLGQEKLKVRGLNEQEKAERISGSML